MRKINYFSLIAIFIIFSNVPVSAQLSIKKIMDYYKKVYPLPYPYPQPEKIPVRFSVDNSQVKIPNSQREGIVTALPSAGESVIARAAYRPWQSVSLAVISTKRSAWRDPRTIRNA